MDEDSLNYAYYFKTLKESIYFSELKDKTIHEFLGLFTIETWSKGYVVNDSSKTFYHFYLVVSGRIKQFQSNESNGNEYITSILNRGCFFDVITLLDEQKHEVQMEALDEVELLTVPTFVIREWINKHPNFNKTLFPYLANQLREYEDKASSLALLDTWHRTLNLFIKHSKPSNNNNNNNNNTLSLINDFSHSEIAKIIGTSRNIINKHIQVLKKDGVINVNRKNIVINKIEELLKKVKI